MRRAEVRENRKFMRKGPAELRLERIREKQKATRKFKEKFEVFGLTSASKSLSTNFIADKFLLHVNEAPLLRCADSGGRSPLIRCVESGAGRSPLLRCTPLETLPTEESVPRQVQSSTKNRSPLVRCNTLNFSPPPSDAIMDFAYFEPMDTDADISNSLMSNENEEKEDWKTWSYVEKIRRARREVRHLMDSMSEEENPLIPTGHMLLVVDTNVFLNHLVFLKMVINKSSISNFKNHTLVTPWPVLQELNHLSVTRKKDAELAYKLRKANKFIHDQLRKKNRKFHGQSFDEFKFNFVNTDDFLHQYCKKLMTAENCVILLTDDCNLSNKAMVNGVHVYTRYDFEETFLRPHHGEKINL